MKLSNNIKNLIFDMGNVIIDIDIDLTLKELKSDLSENEFSLADEFMKSELHAAFESGNIDEKEFRNGIRMAFNREWKDEWIDQVWNTLLLTIPKERIKLLKTLRKDYNLYLLSNTNSIHFKVVEEIFKKDHPEDSFLGLFDKVFLSHEMGLRKPDKKIYEKVVEEIEANPEQCLFFDDLQENLNAAKEVGLQTYLINHPKALVDYFSNVQ
ncbi:MAG TPA: HAD family phosphatase [Cyclobacteriaceae bacterium]|nr:HAD family phosphatase [Cyclobacteriaceae bacterium]